MSTQPHNSDPLASFHKRTTRYLSSVAAGVATASFGCADFYPPPTPTALLQDDDDSYRTEDGSDTENIDSSNRGKRPATKTPSSSKAASQAVSPADEDSSADEDDSDEELDVQDEVDLSIEQLQKRIQKGKITGATNCDLIDSLSGDYRKQKEKMAKSVSSLKKEVKKLENEKKGLEEELEKEIEAHEITKQNLVDLKAKYKAAMQKAKSKRTYLENPHPIA